MAPCIAVGIDGTLTRVLALAVPACQVVCTIPVIFALVLLAHIMRLSLKARKALARSMVVACMALGVHAALRQQANRLAFSVDAGLVVIALAITATPG